MPQASVEAEVPAKRKSGSRVSAEGEPLIRLTVPVLPLTHNDFARLCITLDVNMGERLMQLINHDIDVGLGLNPPEKISNKVETHTKRVSANIPKKFHVKFRLFCLDKELHLKRDYCMADHAEQLVQWDIEQAGKGLPVP